MLRRTIVIAIAMFAMQAFAAPATAPSNEQIVTRVYDISDLLWQKTNYYAPGQPEAPAAGAVGYEAPMFNPGMAAPQPPAPQGSPGEIIKLIEDTVASDTWKDNGGATGSMRQLSGQLVVTQAPEVHQKIQQVLESLRSDRGRMVVLKAYWLLLDAGSVPTAGPNQALPIVDDKLIDPKHLYCQAQTTCFSGQTVHVVSGLGRTVVTGLTPVVGTNSVGYQPQTGDANSGVVLQVTPILEPEGNDSRVVVDLHSNVTDQVPNGLFREPATQPSYMPEALQRAAESIDRVSGVTQQLLTTVRLPLGKKVLIGGMTLEPRAKDPGGQQLYLVIQADAVK